MEHFVLILIVVDNGLVQFAIHKQDDDGAVLILIVVDNGLVHIFQAKKLPLLTSLNPYCSGQWSRTLVCY